MNTTHDISEEYFFKSKTLSLTHVRGCKATSELISWTLSAKQSSKHGISLRESVSAII